MRTGLVRWLIVLASVLLATGAAAAAPRLFRGVDGFRVERVVIEGTHYLAPREVLRASGITGASNVFDDPAPWRRALLRDPLVRSVRVERELPSTLVLDVEETQPVALARTPELKPVDAHGAVLPVRSMGVELDLPVLTVDSRVGKDGRLEDARALRLVSTLARVRALEPDLAAMVSEAAPYGDAVRLALRNPLGAAVLVTEDPDARPLQELRLTLDDLAQRGEIDRVRRIDARFPEQVVVLFHHGAHS